MRWLHIASVALFVAPLAASADTLQYTFSAAYPNSPTHTFSFQIPSSPAPGDLMVNPAQGYLAVRNVAATVDGTPGTYLAVFNLNQFSNGSVTGGDLILAGPFYVPNEPTLTYRNSVPLYTGDPFSPTFQTGTFVLQEFGAPYGGALGKLTVTDISTAVTPEPSGILLSFTGLLALCGCAFRERLSREPTASLKRL